VVKAEQSAKVCAFITASSSEQIISVSFYDNSSTSWLVNLSAYTDSLAARMANATPVKNLTLIGKISFNIIRTSQNRAKKH